MNNSQSLKLAHVKQNFRRRKAPNMSLHKVSTDDYLRETVTVPQGLRKASNSLAIAEVLRFRGFNAKEINELQVNGIR